jgi:hypothetical protein
VPFERVWHIIDCSSSPDYLMHRVRGFKGSSVFRSTDRYVNRDGDWSLALLICDVRPYLSLLCNVFVVL